MDRVYQGECVVGCVTSKYLFNTNGELQYPFAILTKERRIEVVGIDEAYLVWSGSLLR